MISNEDQASSIRFVPFVLFVASLFVLLRGTAGKRHYLAATNCQAIMVLLAHPAEF